MQADNDANNQSPKSQILNTGKTEGVDSDESVDLDKVDEDKVNLDKLIQSPTTQLPKTTFQLNGLIGKQISSKSLQQLIVQEGLKVNQKRCCFKLLPKETTLRRMNKTIVVFDIVWITLWVYLYFNFCIQTGAGQLGPSIWFNDDSYIKQFEDEGINYRRIISRNFLIVMFPVIITLGYKVHAGIKWWKEQNRRSYVQCYQSGSVYYFAVGFQVGLLAINSTKVLSDLGLYTLISVAVLSIPQFLLLHYFMNFIDEQHFTVNRVRAQMQEIQNQQTLQADLDKYLVAEAYKTGVLHQMTTQKILNSGTQTTNEFGNQFSQQQKDSLFSQRMNVGSYPSMQSLPQGFEHGKSIKKTNDDLLQIRQEVNPGSSPDTSMDRKQSNNVEVDISKTGNSAVRQPAQSLYADRKSGQKGACDDKQQMDQMINAIAKDVNIRTAQSMYNTRASQPIDWDQVDSDLVIDENTEFDYLNKQNSSSKQSKK